MIKLQGKLPRRVYVACSGGVDSMAAVDFLSNKAYEFVGNYCSGKDIPWLTNIPANNREKTPRESQEEYWRNIRYNWLERCTERDVITGHHLDDCVETWVWSSMHGTGKIIPYSRNNRK